MLEQFYTTAQLPLSTVSHLSLKLHDTSTTAGAAGLLNDMLVQLARGCPNLASLDMRGRLPLALLRSLGEACPLLSALSISIHDTGAAYLQETVKLLPSLLPNVNSLTLPHIEELLPDMSLTTTILSLNLAGTWCSCSLNWLLLPPKLQHLKCACLPAAPPVLPDSMHLLQSLTSIKLTGHVHIQLLTIAQLLRAAPALRSIDIDNSSCVVVPYSINILLFLNTATAADLRTLQQRRSVLTNPTFQIKHAMENAQGLSQDVLDALPCMTGVTHCSFCRLDPSHLVRMLQVFPNVQNLTLNDVDDVQLQELILCPGLTSLYLIGCKSVTHVGVVALCLRLPSLRTIHADKHCQLSGPATESCLRILERHGSHVMIEEHKNIWENDSVHHDSDSDQESEEAPDQPESEED